MKVGGRRTGPVRTGAIGTWTIERMKTGDFGGEGINESQVVGGIGLRITILPPTHIAQFKTAQNAGKAGGGGVYTGTPSFLLQRR